jgi:hypothetical protein
MMPLRVTNLKLSTTWPTYIILHSTSCRISIPPVDKDKAQFQLQKYEELNFKLFNKPGVTYFHYIVERVNNDFQVSVSQPLLTSCEFDDLDDIYKRSIHVAFLGDYETTIPKTRMYQVLAFRVLSPLMRLFAIKESDILLHSAISNEKDITCPGKEIDLSKILNVLRSVNRRRTVSKRKG